MAYFRCVANSGGGTINPTVAYAARVSQNGGTYSFTINPSKKYISVMSQNYASNTVDPNIQRIIQCFDGTRKEIQTPSPLNFSDSLTGTTWKFTNSTGAQASLTILQLD